MSQEETRESDAQNDAAANFTGEKAEEEMSADSPGQDETAGVENVPVESIGSYARVDELLTDEEKGETTGK